MENLSDLEENLKVLSMEVIALKEINTKMVRKGEQGMHMWLQNVEGKECEVDELWKKLYELNSGLDADHFESRLKLNIKVIECLKDVRVLKQGRGPSSESVEILLRELATEKPIRYSREDLVSFTSNFSTKIGYGMFGYVYKGQLPNNVQVAVKVLVEKDVVEETFMAEVRTIGRVYHKNLIKLFGFCFDGKMKALVYEYMENGSLDKILYENHLSMEWEELYNIVIEMAKGIAYLHDGCHEQIVHHDIKAANILLDASLSPKIADFGLAKLINRDVSHLTLTRIRGTPGYVAPEMWIPSSLVTHKCDVYSFGMLLFEVLGRRKNGGGEKWFPRQVWEMFEKGELDKIIEKCGIRKKNRDSATILAMVAIWCAQFTPQVRPSMSTVVKMLEKEIQVMEPPNPFLPASLISSPQPSHSLEVIYPRTAPISLQLSDSQEAVYSETDHSIPVQLPHSEASVDPQVISPIYDRDQDFLLERSFNASLEEQLESNRRGNPFGTNVSSTMDNMRPRDSVDNVIEGDETLGDDRASKVRRNTARIKSNMARIAARNESNAAQYKSYEARNAFNEARAVFNDARAKSNAARAKSYTGGG